MAYPTNEHIAAVIIPALEHDAYTCIDPFTRGDILRELDNWRGVLTGKHFREFPRIVIPERATLSGWSDCAWHNDAMARMIHESDTNDENAVELWIGDDDTMLDMDVPYRFAVFATYDHTDEQALYIGNNLDAAIDAANMEIARRRNG